MIALVAVAGALGLAAVCTLVYALVTDRRRHLINQLRRDLDLTARERDSARLDATAAHDAYVGLATTVRLAAATSNDPNTRLMLEAHPNPKEHDA